MSPRAVSAWTWLSSFVLSLVVGFGCGDNKPAPSGPGTEIVSVAITSDSGSTAVALAAGTQAHLKATAKLANDTTEDVTAMATWASADATIATVDAAGTLTGVAKGATTITATVATLHGTIDATVTDATLTSLAITPPDPAFAAGTTQQLTATGTFSDQTTQDLTSQVTWVSDMTDHATVSATGLAQGVAAGSATVTASLAGVSATTMLTITEATLTRIDVTPALPSIAAGNTQQFTATGVFSDATTQDLTAQVTWASATPAAATIDAATGLATGVAAGTSEISATKGAVVGKTTLTVTDAVLVSIELSPTAPTIAAGLPVQFAAIGHYSDTTTHPITDTVMWSSTDTAVADISNAAGSHGLASTTAKGTTTIGAKLGAVTASTLLTVSDATLVSIDVTPVAPHVAAGLDQAFVATGHFTDGSQHAITTQVTWSSATPAVATISNAAGSEGVATTAVAGTTDIVATMPGTSPAVTGTTTLTVDDAALVSLQITPVDSSVVKGLTLQYAATGTYTDHNTHPVTTAVTWSAADVGGQTGAASISNAAGSEGLATGTGVGDVTIKAVLGAVSATTKLTVTAATLSAIQVTPVNQTIAAGTTQQYAAVGTYSDGSTPDITALVTWDTDAHAVATVSNGAADKGLASAVAAGDAHVTATLAGKTGSTTLHVSDATLQSIVVEPIAPSVAKGKTQQFTATGMYSDSSQHDITNAVVWATVDPGTAKVSNAPGSQGLATALDLGTTTVSATQGAISGSTTIQVTDAVIVAIAVTPAGAGATVVAGLDLQFAADATRSDGSHVDVTAAVDWESSLPAFAQISNAAGSAGLAHGIAPGTTTISATLDGVTGTSDLAVTAAAVTSIDVTPVDASLAKGRTQHYTAIAHYSDGTNPDVTTQVNWQVADTTVAQISNAPGSEGLLTAVGVGGPTNVTASLGGKTGSTTVAVTAAVLDSITIAPNPAKVAIGATVNLAATAHYSDGTTGDVTNTASWAAMDTSIATVTTTGTRGRVSGVAIGSTTVTATIGATVGTATINVPTLEVAIVSPPDGSASARYGTTAIAVQFNEAVAPATITVQTTAGACTGSLQVSADNFATCLAFAAAPTFGATNTIATANVVGTTVLTNGYKIKVLATATNAGGSAMLADFVQPTGWGTTTDGTCNNGIVISMIYGAGGNSGAVLNQDFIELHNSASVPMSLAGMALQYAKDVGTSWTVGALPAVTLPPGGYFLVGGASGSTGAALPTVDVTIGALNLSGTTGKVALTATTIPLSSAVNNDCPLAETVDFIGFGATATCHEGAANAPAPSTTVGDVRNLCTDNNVNSTDFLSSTSPPAPRNSAATPFVCSCIANETDRAAEIDYCNLQFPATLTEAAGAASDPVYADVYEAGITEAAGDSGRLKVQIGVTPMAGGASTRVDATYNIQVGNNDEYMASLPPLPAGNYYYVPLVTRDGTNWTMCDLDGAGSNSGLVFDGAMRGTLTVTP